MNQRSFFKRFPIFLVLSFAIICSILVFYRSLILSLTIALFVTYLVLPIVDFLTKKLRSRFVSAGISVFVIFGFCFIVLAAVLPYIYDQAIGLAKLVPYAIEGAMIKIDPFKNWLVKEGLASADTLDKMIQNVTVMEEVGAQVKNTIETIWASTPRVLGGMLNFFLVPVITFFLLAEMSRIKIAFLSLIPPRVRTDFVDYGNRLNKTMKAVIKGQLIVAATLGCLYMVGLGAVGLQFGIGIGAIAGLMRIVPYLDVVVGVCLSLIVIISGGGEIGMAIAVGLVFLVVQLIDGMLITPRVIGERAGLHPAIVIMSVIAFSDWFGVFGVIIAVPTLAMVKVSVATLVDEYRRSSLYQS